MRTGETDAVLRNYAAIVQAHAQIAEKLHDDIAKEPMDYYHSLNDDYSQRADRLLSQLE